MVVHMEWCCRINPSLQSSAEGSAVNPLLGYQLLKSHSLHTDSLNTQASDFNILEKQSWPAKYVVFL